VVAKGGKKSAIRSEKVGRRSVSAVRCIAQVQVYRIMLLFEKDLALSWALVAKALEAEIEEDTATFMELQE
jgi:hypothetical protein